MHSNTINLFHILSRIINYMSYRFSTKAIPYLAQISFPFNMSELAHFLGNLVTITELDFYFLHYSQDKLIQKYMGKLNY